MVAGMKMPGIGARVFCILSDFRELSFCGPCGPCYIKKNLDIVDFIT